MRGNSIHVIPCGRDWEVRAEGEAAPFFSAEDKNPVVDYARRLAKQFHAKLVVHDHDGAVEFTEGAAEVRAERVQYNDAKAEYGDGPAEEPGGDITQQGTPSAS